LITELTADDAAWAAELMERRRRAYEHYSPVFWRPAAGVTALHARFLRGQVGSERTVALRGEHGFIICQRRQAEGFVDDFTVEPPGTWDDDGAALLLAAARRLAAGGVSVVRVVTAHADDAKSGLLARLSLSVTEQWWVRAVVPAGQPSAAGRINGPGFSGVLAPAPPVYDPGGPVFHADQVAPDAAPAEIERTAAANGAVLAVIPAAPGTGRAGELHARGWHVASDWYTGRPVAPGAS
jgi:hypothetical protein